MMALDPIGHLEFGLIEGVVAERGGGVFEKSAHLDFSFEWTPGSLGAENVGGKPQQFRRDLRLNARRLQLLRVDLHDVMHRTIAELRRLESLADILAVRPVNLKGCLDELAHKPDFLGGLRHNTS